MRNKVNFLLRNKVNFLLRNEGSRKHPRRVFLLGAIILIALGVLLFKFNILAINKINVQLENINCASSQEIKSDSHLLNEASFLLRNKNILTVETETIAKQLMKKYPCIKAVNFEKQFPATINLTVNGRVARFRVAELKIKPGIDLTNLQASPSSQAALLDWSFPNVESDKVVVTDEGGFVFEKDNGNLLPLIFLSIPSPKIGQQLENNLFNQLTVVFNKLGQPVDKISEASSAAKNYSAKAKVVDNLLLIDSQQHLIFTLEKDILRQLASLQLILQKAKINGREIKTIDLRFDKPVIEYLKNPKNG
jgi:cell division septal protein FtsQ